MIFSITNLSYLPARRLFSKQEIYPIIEFLLQIDPLKNPKKYI